MNSMCSITASMLSWNVGHWCAGSATKNMSGDCMLLTIIKLSIACSEYATPMLKNPIPNSNVYR